MTAPACRPVYAVAGRAIACDRPIAALAALRSAQAPDFAFRRRPVALPSPAHSVFEGTAQVGTRCCRVHSLTAAGCDFLQISGAGAFAIPHDQNRVEIDPQPGSGEDALVEALLGPALALALARRGTFLLHAGAVVLPGRGAVAFLGASGAGKSTLAGLLAAAGEGVALAADDLLAVAPAPAVGIEALPHFPQLKLDAAAMAAIASLSPRYPLLGLYALAPAPPDAAAESGEALPAGSAATLVLGHTIAGRLFADDLLAAHLGFAAAVAGRVPVRRLTVPRRLGIGAEVLQILLHPGA